MPKYLLVDSDKYLEQLKQVLQELKLVPDADRFFSRCLLCSNLIQPIAKKDVALRVPPYTFKTHNDFFTCPHCNKIYWEGTHSGMIHKKLKELGIYEKQGNS